MGFGLIYKFMPRVRVQWHDVLWGAAIASLLFTIGKFLIGLYVGKTGVASGFGAAGSIAVVFVWVYYSAQIFLLGAEFTWAYAHMFGSRRGSLEASSAPELPQRGAEKEIQASPSVVAAASPTPYKVTSHEELPLPHLSRTTTGESASHKIELAKWTMALAAAFAIQRLLPKLLLRIANRRKHHVTITE